jgi:hypothetical protein
MKILKVLSKMRNDFSAIMGCEHCGHQEKLTTGYNDDYYHNNVIPEMKCHCCGKDRAGLEFPSEIRVEKPVILLVENKLTEAIQIMDALAEDAREILNELKTFRPGSYRLEHRITAARSFINLNK